MQELRRSHVKVGLALAIVALGMNVRLAGAQDIAATQPSLVAANAALEDKVRVLSAKVDRLEAKEQQTQTDVSAAIQQVLKDVDHHSQLLSTTDLASGYDPAVGFVIRSDDGLFLLHPGAVLDFRNDTSYRERIPKGGGGETGKTGYDTENGFDFTRVRFIFDGNFTKDITYFVQLFADQGAPLALLDAYGVYHFGGGSPLAIKAGQFKDPVWHERNMSEATLMAVDRSLVEALLGGGQTGRVQGVSLMYDRDRLRGQLVLHDGFNSINTKFYDLGGIGAGVGGGAGVTPTNFGVTGRGEFLVIGDRTESFNPWTEYDRQFSALGDKRDILVLGGGADFSQAGGNDVLFHTIDAQYDNTNGFSAYAAYLGSYRDLRVNQGVAAGNSYDPGFLIQAAYLVTPKIEPFARYDYTYLDGKSVTGLATGEVQEITIGANYYLYKQNVKFTLDASWLPNGAPADADGLGILKDSGHNEFVIRAQAQLAL
ncbi:MAG: OprO/OprP family phosphate-selective porin [Planctomycetota bacterium]|nr:OprO/OprP family phosphate-selective porin [Planctomycetota bacterium]